MAINATNKKSESFDPVPQGAFPARIYRVIHIGTIETEWKGEKKMSNKCNISFEFPTKTRVFKEENGEQPYVLSSEFTLSFGEKANLRQVIEGVAPDLLKIDAKGYAEEIDVEKLIGRACLATVKHKQKKDGSGVFAFIDNWTVLPEGLECPAQVNPSQIIGYENFDAKAFDALPGFIKDKMRSSLEYKKLFGDEVQVDDLNPNDIPF